MDALKQEIERKRKQMQEEFGSRKFVKRAELEKKELEKRRREEEAAAARARAAGSSKGGEVRSDDQSSERPSASATSSKSRVNLSEDEKLDDLVLPNAEVIRRLRLLKQPITLFGEDDEMRLERLKVALRAGVTDTDSELMEGQRNDFLMDLAELKKREKHGLEPRKEKNKEKEDDDRGDDNAGGEALDGESGGDKDKDLLMKANFEELCDEDKILVFFKRLIQEWEQEIKARPDAEKRGGRIVATFKQCSRYLKPLFKLCSKKLLPDDIRQALVIVVDCCRRRDYLAAMDQYIKLAIGNAPWPIGVTMVGIHERSAREKIYANSVAHIMNDETTRKYLQSIKRLMTLCQRRYPSLPSRAVEFNSLANGSDLQTLLDEEQKLLEGTHHQS
ncbi:hypothetical protein SELMODRAFT_405809 [Selaginella moellendorffii]|uniref:Pre-mRNA-splicing factor 18 n=1 Tax=Selaginella moellendorffii TaxID=88036 RepID=D8QZS2_SELML|nr:pre-mRNA-splicing factor 18 [Selaginella moellendorffii]EFJ34458.1 hypothetical protein SELMODRAFT_405809 [Selaginella moellendorffii]|eukprot:XP_002964125.1 pre-mRNA-splicing factor 18 [Selaginella moellendorffii]